jgi:hypothetical protein
MDVILDAHLTLRGKLFYITGEMVHIGGLVVKRNSALLLTKSRFPVNDCYEHYQFIRRATAFLVSVG